MDSPQNSNDVSEMEGANAVIQFDLANQISEQQLQNTYYGRRKLPNDECKNAKEALIWEGPPEPFGRAANKKRSMVEQNQHLMERSPEKWKTSYRDQYRKFAESPGKAGPASMEDGYPEAQQMDGAALGSGIITSSPEERVVYHPEAALKSPNSGSSIIVNNKNSIDSSVKVGETEVRSGKDESKGDKKRHVVIYQDSAEKKHKKPKMRPLTEEEKIMKKRTQGKFKPFLIDRNVL